MREKIATIAVAKRASATMILFGLRLALPAVLEGGRVAVWRAVHELLSCASSGSPECGRCGGCTGETAERKRRSPGRRRERACS